MAALKIFFGTNLPDREWYRSCSNTQWNVLIFYTACAVCNNISDYVYTKRTSNFYKPYSITSSQVDYV